MDILVVGAGIVGLAVARALARRGHAVIVAEAEGAIGTGISARNSEVIHAGIYYPRDSAKAAFCRAGREALAQKAKKHGLEWRPTLTGFKWIARTPDLAFGYEEAIGFCPDPTAVRDKDGIGAMSDERMGDFFTKMVRAGVAHWG